MASSDAESAYPNILLLSSRFDLSTDFIVSKLRQEPVSYLRLNSEDLSNTSFELNPITRRCEVVLEGRRYTITPETLISVLFRRPVFFREYGRVDRSPEENFSRNQWAALMRNLVLYSEARWVNDPVATYRAELKAIQLFSASQVGFAVPDTRISNNPNPDSIPMGSRVAVKGLDTVLVRDSDLEVFGFTTSELVTQLTEFSWSSAPATIQTWLEDKLDIRVTVAGASLFAVKITDQSGAPISGDWRLRKDKAQFSEIELPQSIQEKCFILMRSLGLRFGCIDLALCDDEYYFLEINPTGEWAWLVDSTGVKVDVAMAETLISG